MTEVSSSAEAPHSCGQSFGCPDVQIIGKRNCQKTEALGALPHSIIFKVLETTLA